MLSCSIGNPHYVPAGGTSKSGLPAGWRIPDACSTETAILTVPTGNTNTPNYTTTTDIFYRHVNH